MKCDVLGVMVDNVTMAEAVSSLSALMDSDTVNYVVTPNAEIVKMCVDDRHIMDVVNGAYMTVPDGVGVLHAAKALGTPMKEKVAGCELGLNLLYEAAKKGYGVFLFGSKPGVAKTAADRLCEKVTGLKIAGVHDGYFKPEQEDAIIDMINESGAKLLWVCLGAPRQELWMAKNKDKIRVPVMIGLGGSLDLYAGNVKRAPAFMIKMRCEWLYRLIKEPYRLGRMLEIPKVLSLAKKEAKRRKKNARA